MIPDWVEKILASGGIWGAIVFVLLSTVIALVLYVKSMQGKADKVYGYRLAERDTLNKALTDAASVLEDMLEATKDRNALTKEMADLISKQMHAFELLKAIILGQYESIQSNQDVSAEVIKSMADAVRSMVAAMQENKYQYLQIIGELKNVMVEEHTETRREVWNAAQSISENISAVLGNEVTIVQRIKPGQKRLPRTIIPTRPKA